jgi:hypothetical protein
MHCAAAAIDGAGCRKNSFHRVEYQQVCRMFKKAVQRGRNEGRAEVSYFTRPPRACRDRLFTRGRYVEALSEVRTKPGKGRVSARLGCGGCNVAFFNILLAIAAQSVPYTSRRRECGIADWEVPDVRETYHWHRPQ